MRCDNFKEVFDSAYLFNHTQFENIPTHAGNERQRRKGIARAIDLDEFGRDFPHNTFNSLSSLFASFLSRGEKTGLQSVVRSLTQTQPVRASGHNAGKQG